jgi:hypothetical protein
MLVYFTLLTILGWAATLIFAVVIVIRRANGKKADVSSPAFPVIPRKNDKQGAS